jgi:hypothetical protein
MVECGDVQIPRFGVRYPCLCCGYPTLEVRSAGWEICNLCGWEDDGQSDEEADKVAGGPNYELSLTQARRNFEKYLDKFAPGENLHRNIKGSTPVQIAAKQSYLAAFNSKMAAPNPDNIYLRWEEVYGCTQRLMNELTRLISDLQKAKEQT